VPQEEPAAVENPLDFQFIDIEIGKDAAAGPPFLFVD
jgi:hypothetical protein